jgi:hypothetical protein
MYNLLEKIQKGPSHLLRGKSLRALWVFLCGYETAISDCKRTDITFSDLRPFNEYVAKYYGYAKAGPRSCFTTISLKNESDEKAYDVFFELLANFKKENPELFSEAKPPTPTKAPRTPKAFN